MSIDLEAGIKERSQQWLNVGEEQHNFEDENGKNGRIITKKERGCVKVRWIKDENNKKKTNTHAAPV